jgi:urea carboxylase system permease
MATVTAPSDDARELAALGYKQELVRTLGAFSTFATGFAFISILTGMFLLFAFAFTQGGPASIWAWIIAVLGQLLFALAFAELAVRYPLAGSVYNWSKHVGSRTVSWMAGWALILALTVSTAAVALAFQAILPPISDVFWIYGNGSGKYDASINAVILGSIALIGTTAVFLSGTKVRGIVNNIGVSVELIGVVIMIVMLLLHAHHGPGVVFKTNGTEAGHSLGYVGALLICLLIGLTVQWGFDTAGSVGEETINPRKTNPPAIIRALVASGVFGALLFLVAFMSLKDLKAPGLATGGLAYVLKTAAGNVFGDILLAAAAIAVFVCLLANQTGAVNMIFAMARDNALPGSHSLGRVAAKRRTPIFPPIMVALVAFAILLALMKQPQILIVTTSVTATLALLAYVLVVGPFARTRMRGQWQTPEKGYFTLGKAGLAVSVLAFVWGIAMIINLAWPRDVFYNPVAPFHWYLRWGGVLFPGIALLIGFLVYWFVQRKKIGVLPEHAAALTVDSPSPTQRDAGGVTA